MYVPNLHYLGNCAGSVLGAVNKMDTGFGAKEFAFKLLLGKNC